jgi:hypothetical protein
MLGCELEVHVKVWFARSRRQENMALAAGSIGMWFALSIQA